MADILSNAQATYGLLHRGQSKRASLDSIEMFLHGGFQAIIGVGIEATKD